MQIIYNLQDAIGTENILTWIISTIIFSLILSISDTYIFTNLFAVEKSKLKKLNLILSDTSVKTVCALFISAPYCSFFNMFITIFLYRKFLKQDIEKCVLGCSINYVITILVEIFFIKMYGELVNGFEAYKQIIYYYNYKASFMVLVTLVKFLICLLIKMLGFNVFTRDNISLKKRYDVIAVSFINDFLIFFNFLRIVENSFLLEYKAYTAEILLLVLYFYIAIKNMFKISELQEKNLKIHNLEEYNKTLLNMYDSVRVFKHNFSNFVQALEGYVITEDIKGIKEMCRSLFKECKVVNNMSALNPHLINNPAIYGIITNKYYLAQEKKVEMNIEVMLDFQKIESDIYDLSNILGILLDNAIEAASESDESVVNIKFLKDIKNDNCLIIVENTYKESEIDIEKIFEKGYSTKKHNIEEHGLGLWNVKNILSHNNGIHLYTTKGKLFIQKLEICATVKV